jgi:hypothetical protein
MNILDNVWKKVFINRAEKRTIEIAINMVKEGWSPILIERVTGLPIHQLQKLKFKYT